MHKHNLWIVARAKLHSLGVFTLCVDFTLCIFKHYLAFKVHRTKYRLVSTLITVTGTDLAVDGGYGAMGPEGLGESSKFAGTE